MDKKTLKERIENLGLEYVGQAEELIEIQREHGKKPWQNPSPHYLIGEVYINVEGDLDKDFEILAKGIVLFPTTDIAVDERQNHDYPYLTHANSTHVEQGSWNLLHLLRQHADLDTGLPNNGNWKFNSLVKPNEKYDLFISTTSRLVKENGFDSLFRDYSQLFRGKIKAELWQEHKHYATLTAVHKSIQK